MRKRYIQDRKTGKLIQVGRKSTGRGDTFQVGDLPDIKKDCARWKKERALKNRTARTKAIVHAYNTCKADRG